MLTAPEPLRASLKIAEFHSGEPTLDAWLQKRALSNEQNGASRTYVVCEDAMVVAYYSLAVGSVAHSLATGSIRRNMPDPVPVMVLARLAVDTSCQGRGIGRGLVRDAILRTAQAASIAGIRAMLVHALHSKAVQFYRSCGFEPSPLEPFILMLRLPR